MHKLFSSHPASVGETYAEHWTSALGFGLRLIWAGLACCLHGFFPFLCVSTGSRTVAKLHEGMVLNRKKAGESSACAEEASPLR
jgi:hypothetical protein